jgi:hypothetical protein
MLDLGTMDTRTAELKAYRMRLGYVEGGKKRSLESDARDLEKGWNLVTLDVLGQKRSYLVLAGEPPFVLKKNP